jgi:4-hydroxy-tetrahydrodipicolinate reductase
MMEMMADRFPGCFSGYSLAVAESHQRTKVDTSGTAKAVVQSLNRMGLDFTEVWWVGGWMGGWVGQQAQR